MSFLKGAKQGTTICPLKSRGKS